MKRRTYIIDGIEYQFNGAELEKAIIAAIEHRHSRTDKEGSFWNELRMKTGGIHAGLSRTTVMGWYHKHMPRDPQDLLKVIDYLECDMQPILIPISLSNESEDGESIKERIDGFRDVMRKHKISVDFLSMYLSVCKGYQISFYSVWRMTRGKIIPSEQLCEDILELLAIVEHNSRENRKNPLCMLGDNEELKYVHTCCRMLRTKMQQLGISVSFITKYLKLVKNFEVDWWLVFKVINGMTLPNMSLCNAIEELLCTLANYITYTLFPLTSEQEEYRGKDIEINHNFTFRKAITLVFSRERGNIFTRKRQIRRFENYAKMNNLQLNESYTRQTHDSSWYGLRDAMDMVEAGYYDVILLYSREVFFDENFLEQFCTYAICHNIPIIFLSDMYYVEV